MTRFAGPACSKEESNLRSCPSCPYAGPRCGSRGNPKSPIVFVAEAPGIEEVRHGLPLIGPSGDVFWNTFPLEEQLKEWGLSQNDFLILNACQCLPPRKKNDARANNIAIMRAWQACKPRLIQQIEEHPRKLIVAMGNHANWCLSGNTTTKITQIRGAPYSSSLSELGILPTLHPAALLRGTGNFRQYRADIEYALDLVRGFPKKKPVDTYFLVCDTPVKVLNAVRRLIKKPRWFNDIETTGFNRFRDEVLCWGVAYDPRLVYIIPGAVSPQKAVELGAHPSWMDGAPSMIPYFIQCIRRYAGRMTWHNGKFDISFTRREGDEHKVNDDTMLLSYCHDESGGIHDLEQVASDLLGTEDHKWILKQWTPKRSDSYCKVPRQVLYNYLAFDVADTAGIFPILHRRIDEDSKLKKLYSELLIPFSESAYWIEHSGMAASEFAVQRQQIRLQKELDRTIEIVQEEVRKVGVEGYVSPSSPQQIAHILFDVLKLKNQDGTLPERSTRKEILEKLPQIPIVKAQREFKKAQKQKSTYADTILTAIEPHDGRVHPTLMIHGTRTGRLAHKIIANIPRDKRIRGMYAISVPFQEKVLQFPPALLQRHGYSLSNVTQSNPNRIYIKADLDQAELRVLAAMSADPELCAIYLSNTRKLHREVANDIWGSPGTNEGKKGGEFKWGNEEYMRAKALNFGIIYGRQEFSIADEFGIPVKEAQGYIDYWKNKFPVAWKFLLDCRSAPLRNQTIVTPFGRKKRHWIVTRENLQALQNEASNFPEQSIASDIVLEATNKLTPILRSRGVNIVFLVHDELIAEAPDDLGTISWARSQITDALEQAPKTWGITRVPFKADTSIGRRWGIYRQTDKASKWHEYLRSRIHLVTDAEFTEVA